MFNSPGGSVSAGMAIYDTYAVITCDVATVLYRQAASMGAVCSPPVPPASVRPAKRRIMIHQPLRHAGHRRGDRDPRQGVQRDQAEDERDSAQAHRPSLDKIEKDTDRDRFMSAEELPSITSSIRSSST